MVPPCAKFPISWSHHVSTLACQGAIVCLRSPCQGAIMCLCCPLRVPRVVPKVVHRMGCPLCAKEGWPMIPACAKLPITRSQYMPSCPSQGVVACQIAHPKVPLHAYISHRKGAIMRHIAQRMLPSCAKFIMSRCHGVAMLPIAWCHRRLSHGFPLCQVYHLMVPSCAYVANCVVP